MEQIPINVPVRIDDDGDDDDAFVHVAFDDDEDFGSRSYDPLFAFGFGLRHGHTREIEIDGCRAGVGDAFTNVFGRPQFISDAVGQCALDASHHSAFVSCINDLTSELREAELISGRDRRAIRSCARRVDLR